MESLSLIKDPNSARLL